MCAKSKGAGEKPPSIALMEIAEAAYVSTIGEGGYPDIRAMFNLRRVEQFPGLVEVFQGHDDDHVLYFTTNTSSRKLRQILKNPRTAVYYSLPSAFTGLSLAGDFEVVTDMAEKRRVWQKGWELYYPGGVEDPDHTVLKMLPARGIYYHQLTREFLEFKRR